jgi:hypothetical protein
MRPNRYSIRMRLRHFRMFQLNENFLRVLSRDHAAQFFNSSPLYVGNAPKFLEQFLCCPRAHAGDFAQHRLCLPLPPPLTVKRNRKPVGLVANLLNQVKDRRMPLQYDRLVFLAQHIKYLLFFCNAGDRLIDDLQRFERLRRSVKLSNSAINQDKSGQFFFSSCNRRYRRVTASRMLAKSSFCRSGFPLADSSPRPSSPRIMNLR